MRHTDTDQQLAEALQHLTFCRDYAELELAHSALLAEHGDYEAGQTIPKRKAVLHRWQQQVDELTFATIGNLDPDEP